MMMKTKFWKLSFLLLAALPSAFTSAFAAEAAPITPMRDPRALNQLNQMGDALSKANTMSFFVTSMAPLQGPNSQWIHIFATADVKLQRPNMLRIKTGGDAFAQDLFFDGKTFSTFAPAEKLYSQTEMKGSIDDMLASVSKIGGFNFPFADVMLSDPFASWNHELEGATYVGESTRGGEKLSHLALTAKGVDWEVWIDLKTHLPRAVYVKYTETHKSPAVLIEFSKWKTGESIPPSTFAFHAPQGARKVSLKAPEGAKQ